MGVPSSWIWCETLVMRKTKQKKIRSCALLISGPLDETEYAIKIARIK
jgi:hypothetical protein